MFTDEALSSSGVKVNSLKSILDLNQIENNDNENVQLIRHSSYYDIEKFNNLIHSNPKCFSILGSNIQDIGAKFNELKIFIEEIRQDYDVEFKAICLQ